MRRLSSINLRKIAATLAALAALAALTILLLPQSAKLELDEEEKSWLGQNPEINLGVSFHYPPYETFNIDDRYFGLTADYIRLLENRLGLRFRLVRCVNNEDAAAKLRSGNLHALSTVQPSSALAREALLTRPYISIPAVIITRKEEKRDLRLDDLGGKKVGLAVSEEFNDYLRRLYPKPPFSVSIPEGGYIGGLRDLSMGDYDAMICDMAVAAHYIATAGISNLRVAGTTGYEASQSIAVRQDQPNLAKMLEKALASISPAERQAIEEHWLGLQVRPFWQTADFRRWLLTAFAVVAGVMLLALGWIHSLRAQVASRTALLRSINQVLLRSFGCRREQDVLDKSLEQARLLTASQSAQYGVFDGKELQLETSGAEKADASVQGRLNIPLSAQQAASLTQGQYVALDANRVLIPVHLNDQGASTAILLQRPDKAYSKRELASLAEWCSVVHEVILRKRAERALSEKEMQLQQSQRLVLVGVLAGGIAHDFNNILGAIIANGEMLELFHTPDAESGKKIQIMLEAAYKGRDVVRRILGFTRRQDERKSWVDLNVLVRESIAILETSAPKGIQFSFSESGDGKLYGSGTQLHQLIMNLCVNAVQAMGVQGQLEISVRHVPGLPAEAERHGVFVLADGTVLCSRGCTQPRSEDGYLVLGVQDNGQGMNEAVMEQIFTPLFSTKAPGEGTGLGLEIVDSIARIHKCYILVRSIPGKGTGFLIYFPILPAHEERASGG